MNKQTKIIGALLGAALATASGVAVAESTYGYSPGANATVTASARINLSIAVPRLVLLRIGSAGAGIDTLSWSTTPSWNLGGQTPSVTTGASSPTNWDGGAPAFNYTVSPAAVNVFAWANGSSTTIACTATGLGSAPSAPSLADVSVTPGTVTNQLPHPATANLGACGSSTPIASNVLHDGTWTYVLGGTPTGWTAGTYTGQVTYTAQSL